VSARFRSRLDDACMYLMEAVEEAEKPGDLLTQGIVKTRLSAVMWWQGESARSRDLTQEAIALLESAEQGPSMPPRTPLSMSTQRSMHSRTVCLNVRLS
jgi:hypothetical protein